MSDQQSTIEARGALGRALAERRKTAGYTQHELAALINYGRSTIANVEVGRQPAPRRFWQHCDAALATGGALTRGYDQLAALIAQQRAEAVQALPEMPDVLTDDVLTDIVVARQPVEDAEIAQQPGPHVENLKDVDGEVPCDPMRRRTLVTWGATATAVAGLGITSVGAVGSTDVGWLHSSAVRLHRLQQQHGGETLWRAAVAVVQDGYRMLEQGSYGSEVGQQLLIATGRMQICAGYLAFDAGQHHVARQCFTDALVLARQADDPEVELRALANLALQSNTLDRPRQAQRLATAAGQVASSVDESSLVAVIPQLRLATASSLLADARETDRAIAQARRALDRHRDGQPVAEWCAFLTPFEIDGIEATCALALGQAARAEVLLERVVAGYGVRFARNRALYRVRLARARLDSGAVDGAAEAANAVLDDLSGELASRRVNGELDGVARRLADYPDVAGVDAFLARHGALSA